MLGKTISHYRIIAKLGEGGMGVVYKAEDTKLKREVAIKFLPRHIAASSEERERFKIEAQAAAALNHPNIATIHAIEEVDDEMFIVMEFIEGQELKKKVASGQLSVNSVINFATQIAEGLKAAHTKGITHRDIKSSNIMITESGQVKIMDFGLAKIGTGAHLTKSGMTLGTVAYMSPEQAWGVTVDHRTDIWAFGVVLYEMLTGQLPFRGEYEQAIMYAIVNVEPEYSSEIPPDLKSVLQKALAKEVEQRYQQTSDLLGDLQAIAGEKESGSTTKMPKRRQGNRVYLFAGAAILVMAVLAAIFWWPSAPGEQTIDSIAVLPLDNLSGDPAQEYFSDGMTEALITDLSKMSALKVISRTSVMQFKGVRKPLPEIAKALGVKAVIEGSVMRDGDRVRITAQLIEAESDRHLWADSYERHLTDIFALQRDIAQAIAGQVRVTLTPGEQLRFQEVQKIDPRAYDAYLKGIHYSIQFNTSDFIKSLDYFSQAVALEPNFALGYVGIAGACVGLMEIGEFQFSEGYPKVTSALQKALQLDNSLAEAYSVQGRFKFSVEWDWTGAETAFRKSLELNPNLASAYLNYAIFLITMDRRDEAVTMITKARSFDPLNPQINNDAAWINYCARRYDEAIRGYKNNLELYPDFIMSHRELGWVYAMKSSFEEAIQSVQRAINLERSAFNLAELADVYALAGQKDRAYKILNELLSTRQTEHLAADEFVFIYTGLGDFDRAFKWLETSYQEHSGWPFFIKVEPRFEPLHSDPRYAPFLRKMGLEP